MNNLMVLVNCSLSLAQKYAMAECDSSSKLSHLCQMVQHSEILREIGSAFRILESGWLSRNVGLRQHALFVGILVWKPWYSFR